MSFWRQLARGARVLKDRKTADHDIAAEVGHYLEAATADFIAKGLSPEDARRAARLEVGSATAVREQVRGYGWENTIDTFFADLRYAVRRLRQKPVFAAASLLTLALGIGATTSIFSVIDGVLLKPLPYQKAGQLVALTHTAPGLNIKELTMGPSLYFTYSEESRVFEDVAVWATDTATITGLGQPEELPALLVANRFLSILRVQPVLDADSRPRTTTRAANAPSYFRTAIGDRVSEGIGR